MFRGRRTHIQKRSPNDRATATDEFPLWTNLIYVHMFWTPAKKRHTRLWLCTPLTLIRRVKFPGKLMFYATLDGLFFSGDSFSIFHTIRVGRCASIQTLFCGLIFSSCQRFCSASMFSCGRLVLLNQKIDRTITLSLIPGEMLLLLSTLMNKYLI